VLEYVVFPPSMFCLHLFIMFAGMSEDIFKEVDSRGSSIELIYAHVSQQEYYNDK
jgi:hypothetical protein